MKIYTKTGDKGQTSLLGGKRLQKSHIRIEAYGTVDELNSFLGVLRDSYQDETLNKLWIDIQDRLFTLGSILAAANDTKKFKIPEISEADITVLEIAIDTMNNELEPMRSFILPGGNLPASWAHVCRTVCRRAERRCVELAATEEVPELIVKYLNRLSDYFFILSRFISKKQGSVDTPWKPKV
ncbi:MAG TPA: cob(I)yrinic acid a,c-diamide adenosyltransferase [Flavobacteriales bacterium]|nr:cob(I)yrinic acid a,c-diamide adenosyltransferase [Flavobacteriales bacterium]